MGEIHFLINGAPADMSGMRVRLGSLTLQDVLGAQPNTGSCVFDTVAPSVGDAFTVVVGPLGVQDNVVFDGEIQNLAETYQADARNPKLTEWPVDLIDRTFLLNRRRPFASYVNQSATTVAQDLITRFAPVFTSTSVQANLPALTITCDGSQTLLACLNAIAQQIGGRTKVVGFDVHLFIPPEPGVVPPDPVNTAHRPLNTPPIQFTVDLSQVRTRVYGKGHGERALMDLAVGETIVPIADAVMFTATGGRAIAATTDDGAQTLQLTYTGVHLGGAGTLVGPGIGPTVAPSVAPAVGLGLTAGVYQYAYTDVTATGESLPSPLATVTVSVVAPPPAPQASVNAGTGIEDGDYTYAVTFVTPDGETTLSVFSASVHTSHTNAYYLSPPSGSQSAYNGPDWGSSNSTLSPGDHVYYVFTYRRSGGETTAGAQSNTVTVAAASYGGPGLAVAVYCSMPSFPADADGGRIYRNRNGSWDWYGNSSGGGTFADNGANWAGFGSPPGSNTALVAAINNSTAAVYIALGPTGTTARKLYRWSLATGPSFKLARTIADNTTTGVVDTTSNAALGAVAPSANTTIARQVSVANVAIGPGATTGRKIYRTAVNAAQLKLLPTGTTFTNNTATGPFVDATADGSLGANVPTSDTSGLATTSGQVVAGATSLVTAGGAGAFSPGGGWAQQGQQVIRYTGLTGNTLTGIPASGPGSILTTIPYGVQVTPLPALTGVTGVTRAILKGSAVHVFVQRDDSAAQTALGRLERYPNGQGTDGIRETVIVDGRRGEPSLIEVCDAELANFAQPIVGVTYHTRDPKSLSGSIVQIALVDGVFNPAVFNPAVFNTTRSPTFGFIGEFLIQSVTMTFDPTVPDPLPRYAVTASSSRFTFADLLQQVLLRD